MRPATAIPVGAAAAALVHMAPSTVALGRWLPLRAAGGCVWRGCSASAVALTFDDGPQPGCTERILDRLDELGLPATFFCLGTQLDQWAALAHVVVERGHELATHGYRHQSHFRRPPHAVGADLDRAVDAFQRHGLPRPVLYRPPYGHVTAATMWHARRLGLRTVLWSAMGREWAEPSPAAVAERVERALRPGAIVLLHDAETAVGSVDRVLGSLPIIAAKIRARELSPVTAAELLGGTRT